MSGLLERLRARPVMMTCLTIPVGSALLRKAFVACCFLGASALLVLWAICLIWDTGGGPPFLPSSPLAAAQLVRSCTAIREMTAMRLQIPIYLILVLEFFSSHIFLFNPFQTFSIRTFYAFFIYLFLCCLPILFITVLSSCKRSPIWITVGFFLLPGFFSFVFGPLVLSLGTPLTIFLLPLVVDLLELSHLSPISNGGNARLGRGQYWFLPMPSPCMLLEGDLEVSCAEASWSTSPLFYDKFWFLVPVISAQWDYRKFHLAFQELPVYLPGFPISEMKPSNMSGVKQPGSPQSHWGWAVHTEAFSIGTFSFQLPQ